MVCVLSSEKRADADKKTELFYVGFKPQLRHHIKFSAENEVHRTPLIGQIAIFIGWLPNPIGSIISCLFSILRNRAKEGEMLPLPCFSTRLYCHQGRRMTALQNGSGKAHS